MEPVHLVDLVPNSTDCEIIRRENPIHRAAQDGDGQLLRELLRQKSEFYLEEKSRVPGKLRYPKHWKYHFDALLEKDRDGRTALHLAATVGDPEMSLDCVKALFESVQVYMEEKVDWSEEKLRLKRKQFILANQTDSDSKTPLHLAIESRAAGVVAYLLDHQADMMAKGNDGIPALRLIYEHLPEAMCDLYTDSIQLSDDYQGFDIDWSPIIGCPQDPSCRTTNTTGTNSGGGKDKRAAYKRVPEPRRESENLKHVLNWNQWGVPILEHVLVKLYLDIKWKRVQWFFWLTFMLEMLWVLVYAAAFTVLNLEIKANNANSSTENFLGFIPDMGTKGYPGWWIFLLIFTVLAAMKEVYQLWELGLEAYCGLENFIQDLFIVIVVVQFVLLAAGLPDVVASVSVIGTILATIIMVFQVGKTPYFGRQVAAWKKVIYSFIPHIPVFFIWFIGFGLVFWAILYKAEESWLVNMVAIMAAMGTGELNAEDHLKSDEENGGETDLVRASIRVMAFLFFVIIIVTLYFNLLIGYAVTDIQTLVKEAETLELANKLSTVYTIESFLATAPGRFLLTLKFKLARIFKCHSTSAGRSSRSAIDSIYVMPPTAFENDQAVQKLSFQDVPQEMLKELKVVAYQNKRKDQQLMKSTIELVEALTRVDEPEADREKTA